MAAKKSGTAKPAKNAKSKPAAKASKPVAGKAVKAKSPAAKKSVAKQSSMKKPTMKKPAMKKPAKVAAKAKPSKPAKAAPKPKAASAPKRMPGVPAGSHTVTPYMVVSSAAQALDFYKQVFGAIEKYRMASPDGQHVWHAEFSIGDTSLMIGDDAPEMSGGSRDPNKLGQSSVTLHLYVADVDTWMNRAAAAGCSVIMPPQDMFWGDRMGKLKDPFGHDWSVATMQKEMSPQEIIDAGNKFFANMAPCPEQGASAEG